MPTYEYQCNACGHKLEAFQKMSESPLVDCPACHQASLQKLVSAAGFQLKGTGWYATDFRNKTKPEDKKAAADTTTRLKKPEAQQEPKNHDVISSPLFYLRVIGLAANLGHHFGD